MTFDQHKNLAYSTVATAPSPPTTGTSLVIAAGQGVRFPDPALGAYNCTIWPASAIPTPDNAEIVRVTAKSTDTLTIVRAQEGTSVRSVIIGDQIALTVTAKLLTDVETHGAGHADGSDPITGGAQQAHTVNTSLWQSQAGNARKVQVWNEALGRSEWGYLNAVDVLEPPSITGFTVTPSGAYPGGVSGSALVASGGTETPVFAISYQGTPTACAIDIQSETYAGNPEVDPADYPTTVLTPFTSHTGPAINRGTAVGEAVTFRATATVDSVSKTRDVTLTYVNERLWGISTNAAIDTQGEIDTFRTAQNKELSNSRAKTFSVTPGAGEYIYYILRNALGTPTFKVGGFEGGFSKVGSLVSWSNPRTFVENYDVWRSDAANLGATTVEVT